MVFCGQKLHVDFAKEKKNIAEIPVKSDEKLVQFQSISGLGLEECLQFLENSQWNLESAISLFFDPTATPEDIQLQKDILNISKLENQAESNQLQEMEPTGDKSIPLPEFIFISIREVRSYLVQRMGLELSEKKQISKNNLTDDFVSICYLGGNDFLPGLEMIDLTTGGCELLLERYKESLEDLGPITQDRRVKICFYNFKFHCLLKDTTCPNEYFSTRNCESKMGTKPLS